MTNIILFCKYEQIMMLMLGERPNKSGKIIQIRWSNNWRVQMQKPLNAIWNFLLKWPFLSSLYI